MKIYYTDKITLILVLLVNVVCCKYYNDVNKIIENILHITDTELLTMDQEQAFYELLDVHISSLSVKKRE